MNDMTTALTEAVPTEAPVDLVRMERRRVVGFTAMIETSLQPEELRASLEGMAEMSAFRLESLTEEDGFMRAEFNLMARRGTTGDPQIFALLREIAARHRWNSMTKTLVR